MGARSDVEEMSVGAESVVARLSMFEDGANCGVCSPPSWASVNEVFGKVVE